MKKLLIAIVMLFPVLIVWAAPQPATVFVVKRSTLNDDTPPTAYTDQGGLSFHCGQASGGPYSVSSAVPESSLTVTNGESEHPLGSVLSAEVDGDWYCVAKEVNQAGVASLASLESEAITKTGTNFFVERRAPVAPQQLLVR